MGKMINLLHLNKNTKTLVYSSNDIENIVKFVKGKHPGACLVENTLIEDFLLNDRNKDGLYILSDESTNQFLIYKVDTVFSSGYIYNSVYREIDIIDTYELVESA